MLDHSSDVNITESRRSSGRRARTDWRLGGRTVRAWREWLLAVSLVALGLGVLLGAAVSAAWPGPAASVFATVVVVGGMMAPIVWGFTRSRPAGLLRFRPTDLLWGVGLGVALCLVRGVITGGEFPSFTTLGGLPPAEWWIVDAFGGIFVAPVVEELFFRGILLVSVFTLLRRPVGYVAAGAVAALVSTGLFILLHAVTAGTDPTDITSLAMLGFIAAGIVLLTGRIWGAILLHAVFNTAAVAIGLIGASLG
ncbi:CPBP family intramembrane glutamic endopeptidase [Microbacterium invictum]|uniref:CPBP family intramembrane glutamic endopeptidase n=1 Tax=Microbacterium invictum TaxID=515415 RepID=A0ABZ0V838_9MICO|nr:CPBP family intramembrane glutamic endopeptidase [Microbacterium invictum]WQB69791.1 CPBP family intramembrane glutamic endopeptidase [Microbacterium invictum]